MRRFTFFNKVGVASVLSFLAILLGLYTTTGTASAHSAQPAHSHPIINVFDVSSHRCSCLRLRQVLQQLWWVHRQSGLLLWRQPEPGGLLRRIRLRAECILLRWRRVRRIPRTMPVPMPIPRTVPRAMPVPRTIPGTMPIPWPVPRHRLSVQARVLPPRTCG